MSAVELFEHAPTEAAPVRALTAVEAAVQAGASPDQLERLLELQVRADNHRLEMMREKRRMDEEDRKTAAMLAFRRDFAAFTGENIVVPKSKFVDRGKAGSFWQADWGTVKDMLAPALAKHGLSLRHDEVFGSKTWKTDGVENDIPWVYVTCYLEHKDGHAEVLKLEGPPGELSANTPIQNMQATGSYLKRQSALAITGTATADEDNESKLRNKRAPSDRDTGPSDADEEILQAGRDAALNGMAALNAWWGSLTAKQRTQFSPSYPAMRTAARQVDETAGVAK